MSPLQNSCSDLLSLGEFFVEYWIKANQLQVSVQPMCNSLLLYNMLAVFNQDILNNLEKTEAKEVLETIKNQFHIDLQKPTVAFRLGYAERFTARSPRAPVAMTKIERL